MLFYRANIKRPLNGGRQRLYKFKNGYGASVVNHEYSYTDNNKEWELAVIKWTNEDFKLVYDTPITDDVLGHLTRAEVEAVLREIKAL